MALTQCAGCGNDISKEEKTCPHCGKIASTDRKASRMLIVIVTLIVLAVILYPILEMEFSR
jgi:predicted nucleic acid-binding Zn ribbon protein